MSGPTRAMRLRVEGCHELGGAGPPLPCSMSNPSRVDGRQPPIADYGFLSDCHSAALVDRTGSVDWWCVPRFDSPSVPRELVGHVGETLVLRTTFSTATRRVEGMAGRQMETEIAPRMEYGRTEPHLRLVVGGAQARGGPVTLTLPSVVPLTIEEGTIRNSFTVDAGDVVDLTLAYAPTFGASGEDAAGGPPPSPSLAQTLQSWTSWTAEHTGYDDAFPEQVRHPNDLGLLSEEADPSSGELLGNFPEAFSHVGLVNAAWRLGQSSPRTP